MPASLRFTLLYIACNLSYLFSTQAWERAREEVVHMCGPPLCCTVGNKHRGDKLPLLGEKETSIPNRGLQCAKSRQRCKPACAVLSCYLSCPSLAPHLAPIVLLRALPPDSVLPRKIAASPNASSAVPSADLVDSLHPALFFSAPPAQPLALSTRRPFLGGSRPPAPSSLF